MKALCVAKPEPDSLWDAGKRSSQCRPDGAVKDPDRFQALPAQQRDQPDQNDAALQFRSGMRKIDRSRNARLCGEQVPGRASRRRKEGHLSLRSGRRNGADERQMPDHVADSGLDLNDRKRRHIDCRSMSCDMSLVMQLNG